MKLTKSEKTFLEKLLVEEIGKVKSTILDNDSSFGERSCCVESLIIASSIKSKVESEDTE